MSEAEPIITMWGEPGDDKVTFLMEYQRICKRALAPTASGGLWGAVVEAKKRIEALEEINKTLGAQLDEAKGKKAA